MVKSGIDSDLANTKRNAVSRLSRTIIIKEQIYRKKKPYYKELKLINPDLGIAYYKQPAYQGQGGGRI